jgi:hypothetical protein
MNRSVRTSKRASDKPQKKPTSKDKEPKAKKSDQPQKKKDYLKVSGIRKIAKALGVSIPKSDRWSVLHESLIGEEGKTFYDAVQHRLKAPIVINGEEVTDPKEQRKANILAFIESVDDLTVEEKSVSRAYFPILQRSNAPPKVEQTTADLSD